MLFDWTPIEEKKYSKLDLLKNGFDTFPSVKGDIKNLNGIESINSSRLSDIFIIESGLPFILG